MKLNIFKTMQERKARHIADVYQNQMHPELYLKMERDLKWQPVKTALATIGAIFAVAVFAVTAYVFLAVTP